MSVSVYYDILVLKFCLWVQGLLIKVHVCVQGILKQDVITCFISDWARMENLFYGFFSQLFKERLPLYSVGQALRNKNIGEGSTRIFLTPLQNRFDWLQKEPIVAHRHSLCSLLLVLVMLSSVFSCQFNFVENINWHLAKIIDKTRFRARKTF